LSPQATLNILSAR